MNKQFKRAGLAAVFALAALAVGPVAASHAATPCGDHFTGVTWSPNGTQFSGGGSSPDLIRQSNGLYTLWVDAQVGIQNSDGTISPAPACSSNTYTLTYPAQGATTTYSNGQVTATSYASNSTPVLNPNGQDAVKWVVSGLDASQVVALGGAPDDSWIQKNSGSYVCSTKSYSQVGTGVRANIQAPNALGIYTTTDNAPVGSTDLQPVNATGATNSEGCSSTGGSGGTLGW